MNLKFSHKILLAGCGIVILAFSLFAFYNDYLQRNTIHNNLEFSINQSATLTASSVQNWLSGRVLLMENLAENIATRTFPAAQAELIGQPTLASQFLFTYLGGSDGVFIQRPQEELPEGYDPRTRPWYTDAVTANGSILTEPYRDPTGDMVVTVATPVKR